MNELKSTFEYSVPQITQEPSPCSSSLPWPPFFSTWGETILTSCTTKLLGDWLLYVSYLQWSVAKCGIIFEDLPLFTRPKEDKLPTFTDQARYVMLKPRRQMHFSKFLPNVLYLFLGSICSRNLFRDDSVWSHCPWYGLTNRSCRI